MINGKTLLCIVDYHSKFPIMKKVNSLLADDLLQMTKLIFVEYGLPEKTIHGGEFKAFCRKRNSQQAITLSYHQQSNGQMEAGIIICEAYHKMH